MTMPRRVSPKQTDGESIATACLTMVLVPLLISALAAVDGWYLWLAAKWWGPRLHLPTLPFGHAVAVSLVIGFVTMTTPVKDKNIDLTAVALAYVLMGAMLFGLGLVVH